MDSFGSDPEFALSKDNKFYSAIEILRNNIQNRLKIKGHEFYYDNVLAECAIKPSFSKEETIKNFEECFKIYSNLVYPFKLETISSVDFNSDQLLHPDAKKVGCAGDFCAYTMKQMEGPVNEISNKNLRSCGGHIHVGDQSLVTDGPEPILFVYMLDFFIGIPSIWLDNDESSVKRKSIYGQAGRYRVKTYGIEYRSLGNFWLKSPELVSLIYDLTDFCVDFVKKGNAWEFWNFDIEKFFESEDLADAWTCKLYDPLIVRESINNNNKNFAIDYFNMAKKLLPINLRNNLEDLILNSEFDFYKSWNLKN